MRPLTVEDVDLELKPTREDEYFLDEHLDESIADDLRQRIEDDHHNVWLWCVVEVIASWQGLKGYATLGGCSYDSRQDFMLCEYYPQLVDEALQHLNERVASYQRPCDCEACETHRADAVQESKQP